METVSNYRIKETGREENKIYDELYKRRKRHKQKVFDKMSDSMCNNVTAIELSEDNLNTTIYSDVHKLKRKKRRKSIIADNCLQTANIETNQISNNAIYYEGVKETENSVNIDVSSLKRKNNNQSIAENHQKKKYKSINVLDESDCKITEKSDNVIYTKFDKKKKKVKATDEKYALECKSGEVMQELRNHTDVEILNGWRKGKKKKTKHKLNEMENVLNSQVTATDESGKNRIHDVFEICKKNNNHKLAEVDKLPDHKTSESNHIEIYQNGLDWENSCNIHVKKKKHKQRLLHERENTSSCEVADLNPVNNDLNSENINEFHKKKKKHKLFGEIESMPDYRTEDLNPVNIKHDDLNIENIHQFHKKKKKHKQFDEMGSISDYKTEDSNPTNTKHNDSNSENINEFHKKKKKHKLFDEMESISDCKPEDLNPVNIKQNDLNSENNKFHEKKKKYKNKLFKEMKNDPDYETVDLNCENGNQFYEKKKHKNKLLAKMENPTGCESVDLNPIKISQNELISENIDKGHENKKKKHKKKLLDKIENVYDCKIVYSNETGTCLNQSGLDEFQQQNKLGHRLFNVRENMCFGNVQVLYENEENKRVDILYAQKRNKCESSDIDKISDHKTANLKISETDFTDLNSDTSNQFHKLKRKNHRENLAVEEKETITETNNPSNNIYHDYTKVKGKKSHLQNSVVDKQSQPNRKNKEHVKNRIKILSNNEEEKEKNVSCKTSVKNYPEVAYVSFDPFIHDSTSVPVSFPVPLLHESETVNSITPERRAYLEGNGVAIHTGKWTKTEDDILIRNFQWFGLKFGVNNPFQLLGINQYKRDDELERFKKSKHFLIHLGKDLNNRPLRSIYMRARKLLTPLKNGTKLSAEETVDLKHAHELVGNKWTKISDMLSISDNTCQIALQWHKSGINKGKWTSEEENQLIKAIKTVTGSEDISANKLKGVSWKAVAKYVSTRNASQCHKYWAEHLAWDNSVSEKKSWKRYHYGKLICLLREKYCFNSECEIDWRELHKHFNDVAPSYIYLHKKWFYLKERLPKKLNLSYKECLNALKRMYEEEYKLFANEKP